MSVIIVDVDTTGLMCPLPLLKAKKALNGVDSGDRVRVTSTDQGSWRDFSVFTEQSGHLLLDRREVSGIYTYLLQKK
jgi:tRNA 2-thiouridine synthesizing protein A|tara:strand:+ start:16166 stop:16396 length:231 start_codon:yes stop_codon:yes gene_type:complete